MIQKVIQFSVANKLLVLLGVLGLIAWGGISFSRLPLDAIPDVTNNQVVVATQSPNLSAVEMEQFVTNPIEITMRSIQGLEGIRSVSQFGLSIVTLEFKEGIDLYFARNQVNERLQNIRQDIPAGFGNPLMNPITTGLGEIFQYVIEPEVSTDTTWSPLELRTIQDWVVKKQLLGVEGVAEISSFGGYMKQYHVRVDPQLLIATGTTLAEVFAAVQAGNDNTGAAYIEKDGHNYFIRGIGLADNRNDLAQIAVKLNGNTPVLVRDVATIEIGSAVRYGALTQGDHEAVGGIVLMLKGENSRNVILRIKERLKQVRLPAGLKIVPFLDRELLIDRTISTVSRNLIEGGLIVVFVLVLLLGHLRAGLIVASVIPLSMLFAVGCMVAFRVSGNLMSLGAIDFGLIVDGAVIIVENIIRMLAMPTNGQSKDQVIGKAAGSMATASFFGQIIIIIVYVPLLLLTGIEGKMFQPMALTVIFALTGAVILSLTYVPVVSAIFFKSGTTHKETLADRLMQRLLNLYLPVLNFALRFKKLVLGIALACLAIAVLLFGRMGGEFIPQLDEGDFVVEVRMLPGSSLPAMIQTAKQASAAIQAHFPDEVHVCTGKIGTSEVPMDPMSIEEMDLNLTMHPREQWKRVHTRAEFEQELQAVLDQIPGIFTSIQQPIAMRFNELMSGAKTDVIVQVLGPDLDKLAQLGNLVLHQVQKIEGAEDVSLGKAEGLPQLFIEYRRDALARYGLSVSALNTTIQTALAGQKAGTLFEGDKRFDIVVKLKNEAGSNMQMLENLQVATPFGQLVPLSELADIGIKDGPMAVNRVDGERCVNVALNVRGRDIKSVVEDVQRAVQSHIQLPDGYRITYGGQFENLQSAQARLAIVVPIALCLILLLLYLSFGAVRESLLIFSAIPFAAVGGVVALWLRDMPFSISAGVGFIALFGVAVLNGMVLVGYFQQLQKEGVTNVYERIGEGVSTRFRPVIMTASVASLGFLPMALASGAGAEVQKPLATVVIGGLLSATLLTLVILPVLYAIFSAKIPRRGNGIPSALVLVMCFCWGKNPVVAQSVWSEQQVIESALSHHPMLQKAQHAVQEKVALNQSNMPLPPLQAYTWLPFNPEVGITQNFNNPALVRADRRVKGAQVVLSTVELGLVEQSVRREVTLAYNQCRYLLAHRQLLARQDSLMAEYLRLAEIEFQTGNISALTRLTVAARSKEASRQSAQALLQYRAALSHLRYLSGISDTTWMPEAGFVPRSILLNARDSSWLVQWGQERMQVAALELERHQKTILPGFGLGVVTNVDPYNRFLPNAYFSLNVPVFKKGYRAETEAAKARELVATDEINLLKHEAELRREAALYQLKIASADLDYWNQTGAQQAAELLRAATLSRQAGEATATEYLMAVDAVFSLEYKQLEAIRVLNEAAIHLNFWNIPTF